MISNSVSNKNWIFKKYNEQDVIFYKENYSLDELTSKLLSIRNIKKEDVQTFLNPSIKNFLPNPEILKDMQKSAKRTIQAISQKHKIGIFGDYDVDGASATALLANFFNSINVPYEIYIPDRKKEGYGPSAESFKKLIDNGTKLIFTVDCGTLSFDAIDYASNNDIDVIVLDHHQSEINLPKAHSIVNPNRLDDKSDLKYLCAAGVTFMFLISLNKELRSTDWFIKSKITEPNLLEYLDLVALGTVCDVVPLVGLNRAIVSQGLKILKSKKNLGLKTLFDICDIQTKPNVYHIGYQLGPRINAGGRVGKSSHGANLLISNNPKDVFKIATELDHFNKERQILEKDLMDKVLNILKDNKLIYEGILEKPKGKADLDEWEPRPQLLFKSSLFGDDSDRALKKSDGSWTYFANDMAYHLYKIEKTKGNLINILGADHLGYLKRIESAVKALSSNKIKLVNKVCAIVHLMNDDKKIKMSKRSGNFIMLSDLINDLGKDVIRFIMLTRKNEQVLEFDFKKALAQNKDNPVFYVHYAYARCKSIVKNSNIFDQKFSFEEISMLKDNNELSLIKLMSQ